MTTPEYSDAVFVLDAENGLTNDNRWRDSGPHGLHATPVNYLAPAYGFGRTRKGAAYVSFNGTTQRWTLPLRFYEYAPTGECTVVLAARFAAPALNDTIFDCRDGANRGFALDLSTAERPRIQAFDGAAVKSATFTADAPLTGRTRVIVIAIRPTVSVARAWLDGAAVAATFAGATAPIACNPLTVPTIGSIVGGGNYHDGDLFIAAAWPRIFSHAEAVDISSMLRDRT